MVLRDWGHGDREGDNKTDVLMHSSGGDRKTISGNDPKKNRKNREMWQEVSLLEGKVGSL